MIFGGVLKLNNNLVSFIIVLGFLLAVGCSRFFENTYEPLTNEKPLYFDENTYKHNVYDSNEKQDELSSEYYKNLNPYNDNVMMPASAINSDRANVNNRPMAVPSNDEFKMNNQGGQGMGGLDGMANQMNGTINGDAKGIKGNQIPFGQEDLYILKSQIVPPVCPACPVVREKKKCAPCPPCGRCPEDKFSCKKVPNYRAMDPSRLPSLVSSRPDVL